MNNSHYKLNSIEIYPKVGLKRILYQKLKIIWIIDHWSIIFKLLTISKRLNLRIKNRELNTLEESYFNNLL